MELQPVQSLTRIWFGKNLLDSRWMNVSPRVHIHAIQVCALTTLQAEQMKMKLF